MSTEINPNVPLNAPADTAEIPNANNGPTFDELENIMLNPEHRVRAKKQSAKDDSDKSQNSEKPEKAEGKKDESKSIDIKPNAKSKDAKPAAKKESKETEEAGEKKAEELEKQIKKMLKAKAGDKELELDEDTELFNKVDGEDVPVKLKDLLKDHSGKTAWDKRFSKLDQDRRMHKGEVHKFSSVKESIKQMFGEKDPNVRLFKMATLAGMNPIEFRKQFYDDTIKNIESYYGMTDEERKARDLEFENSYYKYSADAAQKDKDLLQAQRDQEIKVGRLLQQTGIGPDAFTDRYEYLTTELNAEQMKDLESQGKFSAGKPTPDFIVETIQKDALWNAAEDVLQDIKVSWTPEQKALRLNALVNDSWAQKMTPEQIQEVVSELWGKGRAKKVVEKTEAERKEHFEGSKVVPTRTTNSEPMFFGDL